MTTLSPQPPAPDAVTLALPFSPESAAVARHQLRDWLRGLGAGGEQLDDARLVVSEATVKTHLKHTMSKLRLSSRAQAVVVAYETGLVVPGAS